MARLGYSLKGKIPGKTYDIVIDGSGGAGREVQAANINYTTEVLQNDGSQPTTIQPYQTVYYWLRTA